jgi:hypothetical protein
LRDQEKYFEGFTIKNISRIDNLDANEIAKSAKQETESWQNICNS